MCIMMFLNTYTLWNHLIKPINIRITSLIIFCGKNTKSLYSSSIISICHKIVLGIKFNNAQNVTDTSVSTVPDITGLCSRLYRDFKKKKEKKQP
jgi:hypothetical protein